MKTETKELIKAEQRRSDFSYITEVMQRNRVKPSKYIHSLIMPTSLYEELRDRNIIQMEYYLIHEMAFFEFNKENVIISFICLRNCDDMNRNILTYLVVRELGYCPIIWMGVSKMNFDRKIEPVVLVNTKSIRKRNQKQ